MNKFFDTLTEKRIIAFILDVKLNYVYLEKIFNSLNKQCFADPLCQAIFVYARSVFDEYVIKNKASQFIKKPVVGFHAVNRHFEGNKPMQDFINQLLFLPDSASYIENYINDLRELAKLRKLNATIKKAQQMIDDSSANANQLGSEIEEYINYHIKEDSEITEFRSLYNLGIEQMDLIKARNKSKQTLTGVDTGLARLNAITNGYQPSDLIIIAARPSMGKSALAIHTAMAAVKSLQAKTADNNYAVGFFSLEMPALQLTQRFLAHESHLAINVLANQKIQDAEVLHQLHQTVLQFKNYKIFLDDNISSDIEDIKHKIWSLASRENLKLIIVDYLQLISTKQFGLNRNNEVAFISRTLKKIAIELKIPVIALSQLSREVEKNPDKRPMLGNLRDSGAIEQDADIILFLYRDDYYNRNTKNAADPISEIEIKIAKHRNGSLGLINASFIRNTSNFHDS